MIEVTVVCSLQSRSVTEAALSVPHGATVADAVCLFEQELGLKFAGDPATWSFGVWNRPAPLTQVLRPRDRVEIYRPLAVDPKLARRERFKRQGKGRAGLFAKKT